MKALFKLIFADARHHGRSLIGVTVGLTVATMLFALLCALGLGLRAGLLQQWGQALPGHMVEVAPQAVQVGPLELSLGGLLGDSPLSMQQVEDLRQLPHVQAAYPILDVPLPMGAQGGASLFGKTLATPIFVSALPTALVDAAFVDAPDGVIPVVIHESLVTLYNTTVAHALGTPKITSSALTGLSFDLILGRSPLSPPGHSDPAKPTRRMRAKVVGTSPYALPLGISVPETTGQRLWRDFGPDGAEGASAPLRAVLLQTDSPAALEGLGREVAAMGLHVDEGAKHISDMLAAMVLVFALVGALVVALTGVGMGHAFGAYVRARVRELTLMRVVGASGPFVFGLMVSEAAAVGMLSGVLGVAGAVCLVHFGPSFWGEALADVPLLPHELLLLPPMLMAAAVGLTTATAVLGALWPALSASRAPLTRATHGA